jgi:hypothetical protein
MSDIGEYLDKMVVSTLSPDRCIRATVSNYTDVEIQFRSGAFDRYDDERLGEQLARLGLTTWVAYHRGRSEAYRRARNLSAEELAAAERPSEDPRRRRYEQQLNAIEGEGVSTDRTLRVRTVGMMRWQVDIRPGTVPGLGERRFLTELRSAWRSLLNDREIKIILLKSEYFDLGIPRAWVEDMKRLRDEVRRTRGPSSTARRR